MRQVWKWAAPLLIATIVVLVWDFAVKLTGVHQVVLPSPYQVFQAIVEEREELAKGAWVTFQAAGLGLMASGVVGSMIAILFSQSKWLRVSLYPYVIFLQTVPIVAIAPLLILWFGNSFRTVVLVACIISIFPVISNTTSGLLSISPALLDFFKLQSASRWHQLTKLRLPAAVPQLVLGLRISCGLAVIGAIIGEFFVGDRGAYEGLGTIITARQGNLRTASVIAAVLACTALGVLLVSIVNLLSFVLLRRWTLDVGFEKEGASG